MSFNSCKDCGTLLKDSYKEIGYCNDCNTNHRRDYNILKAYLETHLNKSIMEVVNETNLSFRVINRFINEEMVEIKPNQSKALMK